MTAEKLIFWFEELGQEHNDMVGKKCASHIADLIAKKFGGV